MKRPLSTPPRRALWRMSVVAYHEFGQQDVVAHSEVMLTADWRAVLDHAQTGAVGVRPSAIAPVPPLDSAGRQENA